MQVHPDFIAQGLHEVVHQLSLEAAHPLLRDRNVVSEIAAAADIHHGRTQRLVQRDHRFAEAADAGAVAECLAKSAPQHDSDVLDRMMLVDMEVAARLDHEVEEAVACEALKHMVEERHAGLDRAATAAVEVESYLYLGLARLAFDCGRACGKLLA